jgi:hypothetical protein
MRARVSFWRLRLILSIHHTARYVFLCIAYTTDCAELIVSGCVFERIETLCSNAGHAVESDRQAHSKYRSLSITVCADGCVFVLAAQTVLKISTPASTLRNAALSGANELMVMAKCTCSHYRRVSCNGVWSVFRH